MIIKYCPNCPGRPYTADMNIQSCPTCGSLLQKELVPDSALAGRTKLSSQGKRASAFEPADFSEKRPATSSHFGNRSESGSHFGNQQKDAFGRQKNAYAQNTGMPPVKVSPETETDIKKQTEPVIPTIVPPSFVPDPSSPKTEPVATSHSGTVTVRGKVMHYSSTGKEDGDYRRVFLTKWIDALFYGQRTEDLLHRFTVRVESEANAMGYTQVREIPVNVYGTISGGLSLYDNCEVEVTGKYKGNVLMAKEVRVIMSGSEVPIQFQHDVRSIAIGLLVLVMVLAGFFLFRNVNWPAFSSFNALGFLETWLIFAGVLIFLYLAVFTSKNGMALRQLIGQEKRSPLVSIMILAFILAVWFSFRFGTGANVFDVVWMYLSQRLPVFLPLILIVVLMLWLLKKMLFL